MKQSVIPTFNKWGAGLGMLYSSSLQRMLENYATNHVSQLSNISYPYPDLRTGGWNFYHATYGGGFGWEAKLKPTTKPLMTGALSPNSIIRPYKDDSNAMLYAWWYYNDNTGGATVGKKVGWAVGMAAARPDFYFDRSSDAPKNGAILLPTGSLPWVEQSDITFDSLGMPLYPYGATEGKYLQYAVGFDMVHPEKYLAGIHCTPLYGLKSNGRSVVRDPDFSFRHIPCLESAPPLISVAIWRMSAGAADIGIFSNGNFDWDGDGTKDSDDCEDVATLLGIEARFF